jgi:predicted RNA binding protein YcfA (HicA-like mRNA interferase family)
MNTKSKSKTRAVVDATAARRQRRRDYTLVRRLFGRKLAAFVRAARRAARRADFGLELRDKQLRDSAAFQGAVLWCSKEDEVMGALPVVSGDECVRVLRQFGYRLARHNSSSHMRLQADGRAPVTVPRHRELKLGTLKAILRTAGISTEQFVEAWNQ